MLSFILEWPSSMDGNKAWWALRIRVNISEMGSVINLPTGFSHTGNQPVQGGLAESQTRITELAHKAMTPSAHGAAIDQARRARIARQFRQALVIFAGLQLRAHRGVFLDRRGLPFVSLNPSFLCHIIFLRRRACPSFSRVPSPRHRSAPT